MSHLPKTGRVFRRRAVRSGHIEPHGHALRAAADSQRVGAGASVQHGNARRALRFAAGCRYRRRRNQSVQPARLDRSYRAERAYREILEHGCKPLTFGDHTIALPILCAIHAKHGKVGLIHIDAHADVNDTMFGEKIAHGTPFCRAVEEGLLDAGKPVLDLIEPLRVRGGVMHRDVCIG